MTYETIKNIWNRIRGKTSFRNTKMDSIDPDLRVAVPLSRYTPETDYGAGIRYGFVAIDSSDRIRAIDQTRKYLDALVENLGHQVKGEHFTNLHIGNTRYHIDRECADSLGDYMTLDRLSSEDPDIMELLMKFSEANDLGLYKDVFVPTLFSGNFIPKKKLGQFAEALVDTSLIIEQKREEN